MDIAVTGHYELELTPELARAYMTVSSSGVSKQRVAAEASERANGLASALRDAGATNVVVDPLSVHSWIDAERSRTEASVQVRADFADPGELARFQADWSGAEGVQFVWVSWRLTEATAEAREAEVVEGAMKAARRRAEFIAKAAGRGPIAVVSASDPGATGYAGESRMALSAKTEPVDIAPDKVRVSTSLNVVFRAE